MSDYLLFSLLGVGTGATFALLGLGLVLEFRSSRVINLAQGAIAMYVAFVFRELRTSGDLLLPVVLVPHKIDLPGGPLPIGLAILLALAYAATVGLALHMLVFRHVQSASAVAKLTLSAGVALILPSIIAINLGQRAFDGASPESADVLPGGTVQLLGATVPRDRLYLLAIAVIVTAVLSVIYRRTIFGLASSAVAENEKGIAILGFRARRLGAVNWAIASVLAGVAGILVAPISGLEPTLFTLFVIPALGGALVGRLRSFWLVLFAGVGIGAAQSLLPKIERSHHWMPSVEGLKEALPFVVIVGAVMLLGKDLPLRSELPESQPPRVGRPVNVGRTAALALGAGAVAMLVLPSQFRLALIQSLVVMLLAMSVVVITGYCGQVSLMQMGTAGVGGFVMSMSASGLGVPFPLDLLAGALTASGVGVLLALTAIRTRGMEFAVLTLAAGLALETLFFGNSTVTGGLTGRSVRSPELFGFDLGIAALGGDEFPRSQFGIMVVALVVGCGVLVANLRRSATGHHLLAVRARERAASAAGVQVRATKVFAFAFGSFLAGIAGGLLAMKNLNVSAGQFAVLLSVTVLATAYNGGVARISGAVVAGLIFAPAGLNAVVLDDIVHIGKYMTLISGLGLIIIVLKQPSGLAALIEQRIRRLLGLLRIRWLVAPLSTGEPAAGRPSQSSTLTAAMQTSRPERAQKTELLVVKDLSVSFGGVRALDSISLTVGTGSLVGLIGPNGAGKTTAIDAISGLTPSSGSITFDGIPLQGRSAASRSAVGIGRTFQTLELFDELTVEENLRIAATRRSWGGRLADLFSPCHRRSDAAIDATVARLGLQDVRWQQASDLSTAVRKRIALARALVSEPRLLVLDEPAAGLDPQESRELGRLLRQLVDEGVTLFVVDHDVNLMFEICDRIYVLEFGRVISAGTPAETRDDPRVVAAYLGNPIGTGPDTAGPLVNNGSRT